SGSRMSIGALDGSHQSRRLRREMLSTPEQLANRRIGRRRQRPALFTIEFGPLGLVAWFEQGFGTRAHGLILPHLDVLCSALSARREAGTPREVFVSMALTSDADRAWAREPAAARVAYFDPSCRIGVADESAALRARARPRTLRVRLAARAGST